MIQFMNNLINNLFKGMRFITYCIATIIWLLLYPILYTAYKTRIEEVRDDRLWESHPSFILFIVYVRIAEFYRNVIF